MRLPLIAGVCGRSLFVIGLQCGRAYRRIPAPTQEQIDARNAYLQAFRNYERAARELNDLANAPLFTYLDQPLG